DPSDAQPVHSQRQQANGPQASGVEPVGLIEVWLQVQIERGACFVPHAVVVARQDLELITSRRNACIRSDSFSARFNPILIEAFQYVLEADFLRRNQTQGCVIKLITLS